MERLRIFECYAGYGGCSFALKKANIEFDIIGFSEIKQSVINIYNRNHFNYFVDRNGEVDGLEMVRNYGDITKIDPNELPDFDLISGGFPCQDVSLAGLRDLSKGRTLSVISMLEIIKIKKPKYCVLENVKGILSMDNGELLKEIIRQLKAMGYAVSYKLLNSLDYGIPQNRERVIICCELNRTHFGFNPFPEKRKLNLFLNDLLEKEVDDKYYLNEKNLESLHRSLKRRGKELKHSIRTKTALCLMSRHPSRCFHDTTLIKTNKGLRILTPKETFRHMGFVNDEIKIDNFSDTQLYEASGNGWDINLFSLIFERWLK